MAQDEKKTNTTDPISRDFSVALSKIQTISEIETKKLHNFQSLKDPKSALGSLPQAKAKFKTEAEQEFIDQVNKVTNDFIRQYGREMGYQYVIAGIVGSALIGGVFGSMQFFDPSLFSKGNPLSGVASGSAVYGGIVAVSAVIGLLIILGLYVHNRNKLENKVHMLATEATNTVKKIGTLNLNEHNPAKLYPDNKVIIYAPDWVQSAWKNLANTHFRGKEYIIHKHRNHLTSSSSRSSKDFSRFTVSENPTLRDLLCLAQSDSTNCDGHINYDKFPAVSPEAVHAMISLAALCVVGTHDEAEYEGGFGKDNPRIRLTTSREVFVGAYSYPQFQQPRQNTGRLFLYDKTTKKPISSTIDQKIFSKFTNSDLPERTLEAKETDKDLVEVTYDDELDDELDDGSSKETYLFDTKAYQDYMYSLFKTYALGMIDQASKAETKESPKKLNLKFLNGGTFAFLGSCKFGNSSIGRGKKGGQGKAILSTHMLYAVQRLVTDLRDDSQFKRYVGQIELPFFQPESPEPESPAKQNWLAAIKALKDTCAQLKIPLVFNERDVLAEPATTSDDKTGSIRLINAVGNAGDPQAAPKNEGSFKHNDRGARCASLDPAVINALKGQGYNLAPHLNPKMQVKLFSSESYGYEPEASFGVDKSESPLVKP